MRPADVASTFPPMDTEPAVERDQALAGIHFLIYLAGVDGVVGDDERRAITPALGALGVEGSEAEALFADALFAETGELAARLEAVTHRAVRRAVIRAAYALALAGGVMAKEVEAIEAARGAWALDLEDPELELELRRLKREEEWPTVAETEGQERHIEGLIRAAAIEVASLALGRDELESHWRGRKTDISELTRRFMRGEATADEVSLKFKEDIGEA